VLLKREKKRKDRRKEIGEGGYDKNMVLCGFFFIILGSMLSLRLNLSRNFKPKISTKSQKSSNDFLVFEANQKKTKLRSPL
jgi:hypothetical protein